MKFVVMRFFALSLLVAGSYAQTCTDTASDDADYACPTGYTYNTANNDVAVTGADVTADNTAACCDADTNTVTPTNFGLIANSNYAAAVSVTTDVALVDFACNDGYTIANKADGTTPITITLSTPAAADGAFTTTSDDDNDPLLANTATCVAKTGSFAGDANSGTTDATTLTFGAAATTITCSTGYQVANAAADGFQGTYTVALAVDGTATTFVPTTANAGCAAIAYTGAAVTLAGVPVTDPVTTAIAGTNILATVDYTFGAFPTIACTGAGKQLADGITGAFVTADAATGAGTFTVTDANTTPLAVTAYCVDTPTTTTTTTTTTSAADGSAADGSAGSADESAASPAALAAAGMAAIALLL